MLSPWSGASRRTRALLAPINSLNEDPVKDLEVAGNSVSSLIARHLESKGIKVEQVQPGRFKSIAGAASRSLLAERESGASDVVSAEVDFGDAIPGSSLSSSNRRTS